MTNNLNYKVLPIEPKLKEIAITEMERDEARFSDRVTVIFIWIAIAVAISFAAGGLSIASGFTFDIAAIIGTPVGVIGAFVAISLIPTSIKESSMLKLKRQKEAWEKHSYESQVSSATYEAQGLTYRISNNYESSTKLATELREHLNQVSLLLKNAEYEYKSNAFAPFWDAVENAAEHLSEFNDKTNTLSRNADEYYRQLKDREHTFPPFPVQNGTIPDTTSVTKEFQRVVRMGQTNFEFANIWEHRRTRRVLTVGFRTLGEAVNNLGATLENSIHNFQQSVSSDLARVIEEQIKTRESLNKRMIEQNQMLDNIQNNRKPDTPNKPSED